MAPCEQCYISKMTIALPSIQVSKECSAPHKDSSFVYCCSKSLLQREWHAEHTTNRKTIAIKPKIRNRLEKHFDKEETLNQVFVAFAKFRRSSYFRPFVFNCPFIWRAVDVNAHQAADESDVLKRSNQGRPTAQEHCMHNVLHNWLQLQPEVSFQCLILFHGGYAQQHREKIINRPAVT